MEIPRRKPLRRLVFLVVATLALGIFFRVTHIRQKFIGMTKYLLLFGQQAIPERKFLLGFLFLQIHYFYKYYT